MRRTPIVCVVLACACTASPTQVGPRPIASTPIATTGPMARELLATSGFTWHSFQTPHIRLHLSADIPTNRASELADSAEQARSAALALIGEPEVEDESLLELLLVENREDMRRLVGQPAAGNGYPDELSVVMVAGNGFHGFFRHELTHTYASHRWGPRRSGSWLNEGLAARATGLCQALSVDAVAAGYVDSGTSPTLDALNGDFYRIPELPGYFSAASLVDFIARGEGIAAVRALWRGERPGTDAAHPLGAETQRVWSEWRRHLATVAPATLDTARLGREGC
jgi:hypothetical protein